MTARAIHGVRALDLGQAQGILALRTFTVSVRFAIPPFVFTQTEKLFRSADDLLKASVFLLTLIAIS